MRRLPWDKSPASMVPKNAVSFELNSSAFKLTLALYILSLPRFIAFTGISTVSIVYKTDGISEASSLTRTGCMI